MQPDRLQPKATARSRLEDARSRLIELSRAIHSNPELAWEEHRSSKLVAEALSERGFEVEHPAYGLPTALRARSGSGALRIGFCAEYDALPLVGHACGHNLIAAMAVGAAVALAAVADDLDIQVEVLGTPAEERDGGKIDLLAHGAFDGWHAALMVHPAPLDVLAPPISALAGLHVRYDGVAAAAAAAPEDGVNAADALVVAQVAVGLLRQQLAPGWQVSGYIDHAGEAANVIPATAEARYVLRASTAGELRELRRRVVACFEAGAVATGASLHLTDGQRTYAAMRHDPDLTRLYRDNAHALGRSFVDGSAAARRIRFSTDMANVSQRVAAIHPLIAIDSAPAVNHSAEFAAHCVSDAAHAALFDGALALAWTAIDVARDGRARARLLSGMREVVA